MTFWDIWSTQKMGSFCNSFFEFWAFWPTQNANLGYWRSPNDFWLLGAFRAKSQVDLWLISTNFNISVSTHTSNIYAVFMFTS